MERTTAFDPHHIQEKFDSAIKNLETISNGNGKTIKSFIENYKYKQKTLSLHRKVGLLERLQYFARLLDKPLKEIKAKDLKAFMKRMQEKEKERGKPFSLHTWKSQVRDIKVFLKWLKPKEFHKIMEECETELQIQNPYTDSKRMISEQDLLSEEDFLKLLTAADKKTKAILALLYGCGLRASELCMERRDVKINEDGTISIDVFGKTGSRQMKLRKDLAWYVIDFMNECKEGNALFYKRNKKRMDYGALRYYLEVAAVKAGLGKWKRQKNKSRSKTYKGIDVSPLRFRRTHITWCLRNLGNETLAKKRVWGNEASGMIKVYSRLTSQDSDALYDVACGNSKPKEAEESKVKGRVCFKCQKTYGVTVEVCPSCMIPLDPQEIEKLLSGKEELQQKIQEEKMKLLEARISILEKKKG